MKCTSHALNLLVHGYSSFQYQGIQGEYRISARIRRPVTLKKIIQKIEGRII